MGVLYNLVGVTVATLLVLVLSISLLAFFACVLSALAGADRATTFHIALVLVGSTFLEGLIWLSRPDLERGRPTSKLQAFLVNTSLFSGERASRRRTIYITVLLAAILVLSPLYFF